MFPISVVHILHKNLDNTRVLEILEDNSEVLRKSGIEYLVFDLMTETNLVSNIKNLRGFKNRSLVYVRKNKSTLKEAFLDGCKYASFDKVYFFENDLHLNEEVLKILEDTCPILTKKNINIFRQNFPDEFSFSDFHFYIKEKKTFFDKLKFNFKKF